MEITVLYMERTIFFMQNSVFSILIFICKKSVFFMRKSVFFILQFILQFICKSQVFLWRANVYPFIINFSLVKLLVRIEFYFLLYFLTKKEFNVFVEDPQNLEFDSAKILQLNN